MSNEQNALPAEVGPAADLVGGRYRLLEVIGAGNMGEVHRAVHHITGQVVALKLLQGHVVRGRGGVVRFLREVRAASTVAHPGVVPVFDAGSHLDTLYIAMELLEGEAFRERLQKLRAARDPGTAAVGLAVVRAALEPLAAAHTAGIVHRDFKPDNVFLQRLPDGGEAVRLLDFGIASDQHDGSATQTGFTVGTPFYMSPEQAMDPRTCTAASDVWSVGAVLYEVLAGQVPFDGATAHAVCMAAVRDPHPPLTEVAPGIDAGLAAVVDACLSKVPEQRPPDARALATALDALGFTLSMGAAAHSAGRSGVSLGNAALGSLAAARRSTSRPLLSAPGSISGALDDLPGAAQAARRRWVLVAAAAATALALALGVAHLSRAPEATDDASPTATPPSVPLAPQSPPPSTVAVDPPAPPRPTAPPSAAESRAPTAPASAAEVPTPIAPPPAVAASEPPVIPPAGMPSQAPVEDPPTTRLGSRAPKVAAAKPRPAVRPPRRAAPPAGAKDDPSEAATATAEPPERVDPPEPRPAAAVASAAPTAPATAPPIAAAPPSATPSKAPATRPAPTPPVAAPSPPEPTAPPLTF